jgi:hypothetical protein
MLDHLEEVERYYWKARLAKSRARPHRPKTRTSTTPA